MRFVDASSDRWQPMPDPDGALRKPDSLLTLEQWQAVREGWPIGLPTGLLLPNSADVETLAADLPRLALIALEFPKWTDGRAYSQARLLRSRLRYRGELRGIGEVLVDMLPLLQRTGFDAVRLRADQSLDSARRALGFFNSHYQGDVAQTRPHFSRLAA